MIIDVFYDVSLYTLYNNATLIFEAINTWGKASHFRNAKQLNRLFCKASKVLVQQVFNIICSKSREEQIKIKSLGRKGINVV